MFWWLFGGVTIGIGENQDAGNDQWNAQNLPHVEAHTVFKFHLIFFQEFVTKTQAPQYHQKPSEDEAGWRIFFFISPKPKQKDKKKYAGKRFVQLSGVPGDAECPYPGAVCSSFFLCYFIAQRLTRRLVHKLGQPVEIELHIAYQKLANLIFLRAGFEKEIKGKGHTSMSAPRKGNILPDLHGLPRVIPGLVVHDRFCDTADKHDTDG